MTKLVEQTANHLNILLEKDLEDFHNGGSVAIGHAVEMIVWLVLSSYCHSPILCSVKRNYISKMEQ